MTEERTWARTTETSRTRVSRGIERGVGDVVTNIAEAYVIGGCFILILKAIGFALLGLVVLGFVVCGK